MVYRVGTHVVDDHARILDPDQYGPLAEAYLAQFDSTAPVTAHKAGPNEAAFNKLVGGSDG